MNIDDYYGSDFLTAEGVQEQKKWVILDSRIEHSEKYDKDRIVLSVEGNGVRKDWTLNRTNANKIAELLGTKETNDWVGATLTLYTVVVSVRGEEKQGIRVKEATKGAKK